MTRSTRKVPIRKQKPKCAGRIRRSFNHALRQASNRAIERGDELLPDIKEVTDEYSLCDAIENGYHRRSNTDEDRKKIKRK